MSAQFYTIARSELPVSIEQYETEDINMYTPGTAPIDSLTIREIETDSMNIYTLTPEQRRQLYLQLVYYDNEIDEQILALFELQMARESTRLKHEYIHSAGGNTNYDFEYGCPTGVKGAYTTSTELTLESVLAEILRNELAHPRVVLAQAVLETGWFKSSVCRNMNNLFGLTNPRTKEYYRFDTWQESVTAYYTKVQYRYKGGNYLTWLREIGYAEDPDYTAKLRVLLDGPLQKFIE